MFDLKRNNVRVLGNGPRTMVLAHGFGCDQNMWRHVTPAFADEFRLVLFDYVGHGQSNPNDWNPQKYSTLDGYADDVVRICEALDVKDAVFVGHSVSAMIGVLAERKAPGLFREHIMIGPSPRYVNDGEYQGGFTESDIAGLLDFMDSNFLGWSSTMAPVIMSNKDRPELSSELEASFCRTEPIIAKHFARVTFLSDNRLDLAGVKARTLVLQCTDDAIAPTSVGQYVHANIPNSSFKMLPTVGHCPHLSDPVATVSAMREFLQRGGSASARVE